MDALLRAFSSHIHLPAGRSILRRLRKAVQQDTAQVKPSRQVLYPDIDYELARIELQTTELVNGPWR